MDLLEVVQRLLPVAIALNANLNTTENHLFATSKVNSKLDNITVPNLVGFALHTRLREPDVVEEGSGA